MAPGVFSVNSNGVGLGQGGNGLKPSFRGFQDGNYSMTYDGIRSRIQTIPRTTRGRFSPANGLGAWISTWPKTQPRRSGPTNFGGSINLLAGLAIESDVRASGSYGSFNTRLLDLSLDSGQFGPLAIKRKNRACLSTFINCCRMDTDL